MDELKNALFWICYQYCNSFGRATHNYMEAGEEAFRVLGIKDGDLFSDLIKQFKAEGWLTE